MKKQKKKQFQGALILSTLLHFIIVGLFYFGLPSAFEKLPEEKDVLTFEVVPASAIANIKTENKSTQKEKIAEKSKEIKTSKPVPKKQVTPPKKIIEKEEPKKEKEIVPVKEKAKPKKTPPKKVDVQEQEEDRMDAILKNLEKESKGNAVKTPTKSQEAKEQSNKTARGAEYDEELPLSITEELYIQTLINKNWRRPAGLEYSKGINLKIHLELDKTGKIIDKNVKATCPSNYTTLCALLEESVSRAIKKIDPIENLSPDRYNAWKGFTLNFDPELFNCSS